eukprot:25374-Eustigmatos_ZCMA.PRE.1
MVASTAAADSESGPSADMVCSPSLLCTSIVTGDEASGLPTEVDRAPLAMYGAMLRFSRGNVTRTLSFRRL